MGIILGLTRGIELCPISDSKIFKQFKVLKMN